MNLLQCTKVASQRRSAWRQVRILLPAVFEAQLAWSLMALPAARCFSQVVFLLQWTQHPSGQPQCLRGRRCVERLSLRDTDGVTGGSADSENCALEGWRPVRIRRGPAALRLRGADRRRGPRRFVDNSNQRSKPRLFKQVQRVLLRGRAALHESLPALEACLQILLSAPPAVHVSMFLDTCGGQTILDPAGTGSVLSFIKGKPNETDSENADCALPRLVMEGRTALLSRLLLVSQALNKREFGPFLPTRLTACSAQPLMRRFGQTPVSRDSAGKVFN